MRLSISRHVRCLGNFVPVRYRRVFVLFLCWFLTTVLLLRARRQDSPSPHQTAVASPPVPAGGADCAAVLRMSSLRHRWELRKVTAPLDTCTARPLEPLRVRQCVQSPPGQPAARVVFVGDSRLRNIFERTLHRLGLPLANRSAPIAVGHDPYFSTQNITSAPPDCFEIFKVPIRPDGAAEPQKLFFCSRAGGGDWLRLEHRWRVYLSRSFRATLAALADECARRPADCPRLVVLDSGLWYARRFSITQSAPAADWVSRYRHDLNALLPPLRRLAAATRVIWKIDEPQFRQETEGRKPGVIMAALAAIQAAVYSQTAGLTNLTIWSSMLPDTLFFYRAICWRGRQEAGFAASPMFRDCANMHHVGAQLLDRHVTQLLNYLCVGSPALRPGDCCAAEGREPDR